MRGQFHTSGGIVERDLTLKELKDTRDIMVGQPGLRKLIKVLSEKFPNALGTLLEDIKKEIN